MVQVFINNHFIYSYPDTIDMISITFFKTLELLNISLKSSTPWPLESCYVHNAEAGICSAPIW
jgi:hypothetical protein